MGAPPPELWGPAAAVSVGSELQPVDAVVTAHSHRPVCLRGGRDHRGHCVFSWASADTFPSSVHLTLVTNLHNRPKNPGRWTPKKNWSGPPSSKRRGLCTSRCVRPGAALSSSKHLLRCQRTVLMLPVLSFITPWAGISLTLHRPVIPTPWPAAQRVRVPP